MWYDKKKKQIKEIFIVKRLVALVSVFCLLFMLTGCTGKCEICGKEGKVNTVTVDGVSGKVCDDCKKLVDFANSLS